MILIGQLADRQTAYKIRDELRIRGIELVLEFDETRALYSLYVQNPADQQEAFDHFRVRLGFAPAYEPSEEEKRLWQLKLQPATAIFLITGSLVGLFLMMKGPEALQAFFMAVNEEHFLTEVRQGEWWRLVSPIFLHFGLLHILFNMICLKDFGSLFEVEQGLKRYLGFFLLAALVSNLAQYAVMGPRFGGYSGVLFGLLSWLWAYGLTNPDRPPVLPKSSVGLLFVWYFLCLFGVIPQIANMAHGAGLVLGLMGGALFGVVDSNRARVKQALMIGALATGLSLVTFAIEWYRHQGELYYQRFF